MLKKLKLLLMSALLVLSLFAFIPAVHAKTYSENGTWKRKISGTYWYFDVNDYTSPSGKARGMVYIYKGTSNYKKGKHSVMGQYYKVKTNKYYMKYSGGKIYFTVSKKSIYVKQTKGKVAGRKLKGTFKLVKRHYS
ncbi:MAG: hypothetical protein ACSW8B_00640 [bacterium]